MTTPTEQGEIDAEKGEFPSIPEHYTLEMKFDYLKGYDRVNDRLYKELGL